MKVVLAMVAVWLVGCAGTGPLLPPASLDEPALLSGERMEAPIPPATDTSDWLSPTPEMQALIAATVPSGSGRDRVDGLIAALQPPGSSRFTYQADATHSAAQAFEQRRANCLSFSAMMVSLLREAGIDARFQRAEVLPGWEMRGDLSVRSQHVNTLVELGRNDQLVLDWPYQGERVRSLRAISDREALAEYHNNLGAEALVAGRVLEGFAELRRAAELAPDLAHVWSNLAVAYQRLDDALAAESAWLIALAQDPDQPVALGGLHRLYETEGRMELAALLEARLMRQRGADPYHHYLQARHAINRQEWQAARDSLKMALALRNDLRFRSLLREIDAFEHNETGGVR